MTHLPIIFEDKWILAINKPANIHCTGKSLKDVPTISDLLKENFPFLKKVNVSNDRSPLLQRLDYETSGALLVAKTNEAWSKFRELFKSKNVEKTYLALLDGKIKKSEIVTGKIGSPYRHAKKVRVYPENSKTKRILPAESTFHLVKYLEAQKISFVRINAETGRRHQIRAHSSFLRTPLIGDELYGSKQELCDFLGFREAPKFFLHASRIDFIHPFTQKKISILAELPEYAKNLVEYLNTSNL